jgi:hypothetical protein
MSKLVDEMTVVGVEIGSPAASTLTWPEVVVVAGMKVWALGALLIPVR